MSTPAVYFHQTTLGDGPYAQVLRSFGGISPFGSAYFVNTNTGKGSDANDGKSPALALATLSEAVSRCIAGDSIIVAPGSAIALTAVQTLSLAGLSLIGVGSRGKRPVITVNAAADGLSLEAAGIVIDNFHFAAPETDEATSMINVAAAGCEIRNISGIGSKTAKNFVDCITIAAGADDLTIENVRLWNSVVAVNSFISIEAAVNRLRIFDSFCFGDVATGGLIDGAKALQVHLRNLRIGVVGTTMPAATLDSNPTGMAEYCFFSGTHTTLATNGNLGNLMRLNQVFLLEEFDNSKQGVQIPAVDVD